MTTSTPVLGDSGEKLWRSVMAKDYVLRPDELHRLEGVCKTADMVSKLEEVWVELGCPMMTKGSMGQEIIHPLIGELRAQRAALDAALVRLKLPDDDSGAGVDDVSTKARSAAAARWDRGA
jgi:hypothetical protein